MKILVIALLGVAGIVGLNNFWSGLYVPAIHYTLEDGIQGSGSIPGTDQGVTLETCQEMIADWEIEHRDHLEKRFFAFQEGVLNISCITTAEFAKLGVTVDRNNANIQVDKLAERMGVDKLHYPEQLRN